MSINELSVIMPVYNGQKYLREAIDSVLSQTASDFEFIIIDDGSTDASQDIIQGYANSDGRIKVISRENRGLIASLNEGINIANGKYIARMDADDICLPTRFEKQLDLLKNSNVDICGCHFYLIDGEGSYIDAAVVPIDKTSFPIYLCYTTPFAHGSIMFKSSVFSGDISYGMTKHRSAEDYALWSELYRRGVVFGNVNEFLFKYRDFGGSLSKVNRKKVKNDAAQIAKSNAETYREEIVARLSLKNRNCFSKREEEILAISVYSLVFCCKRLSELSLLIKLNKRAAVVGFLRFVTEIF